MYCEIKILLRAARNRFAQRDLRRNGIADLERKIAGFTHQVELLSDKRNTILRVNRVAKTALDIFADILVKEKPEHNDLELLINRIKVYEDHLETQLQQDIDSPLRVGETVVYFNSGIEDISQCRIVQTAKNRPDQVFDVHAISNGAAAGDMEIVGKILIYYGGFSEKARGELVHGDGNRLGTVRIRKGWKSERFLLV